MSFLDSVLDKAGNTIADGAWIDSGAKKLKGDVVSKLPTEHQANATKAVDRIVEGKGALAATSHATFTKITAYLGMGMESEARLAFLREHATFAERQAARKAAIGASVSAQAASEKAWEETKAVAKDVLKYAGPIALQLLLAMV